MRTALAGVALALGVASASLVPTARAVEVDGVEVEPTQEVGGTPLTLAGAGTRTRFFIELYVAALYLPEGMDPSDATGTILADAPMAITLDIVSDRVTRERMVEALEDGFEASTGGDTARVQGGIDAMLGAMDAPIVAGSAYTLAYEPGVGTRVSRDGEEILTVEGEPFKRALFGIWLSDDPVQASLKKAMTGG